LCSIDDWEGRERSKAIDVGRNRTTTAVEMRKESCLTFWPLEDLIARALCDK